MNAARRALARLLAVAIGASIVATPAVAAGFFFVDNERVLATLKGDDAQAKRIRRAIVRTAQAVAAWELPASTNFANDRFVPVGDEFDWTSNPTPDPEFIHAAMRFDWAPLLVLAAQSEARPDYLDALHAQLASFGTFQARSGNPLTQTQVRYAPVWRYLNASLRTWNLLLARTLLPQQAPATLRAAIDEIVERDLDWLAMKGKEQLHSGAERLSNWDIALVRGLIAGALLQPGRAALYETGLALLDRTLERSVLGDGMLWEGSIQYHVGAARWYAEALLLAQRHGKTIPPDSLPVLGKMADVARNFVHADGLLPALGDSDRGGPGPALAYLDEVLQAGVDGPLPPEPLLGSRGRPADEALRQPRYFNLPKAGFVVVRDNDRSSSLVMDYGPKGGWHGHADLFTFELFDLGELLIVDPGRWLYDDGDGDRAWVVSTQAHNTIAIGGQSHRTMEHDETWSGGVEVVEQTAGRMVWRMHVRHHGYDRLPGAPVVERSVETAYDGRFRFTDRVTANAPVSVAISFLTPSENVRVDGNRIVAEVGEARLQIDLHEAAGWSVRTVPAWYSPVYAVRKPATQILIEATCSDCRLDYQISASGNG